MKKILLMILVIMASCRTTKTESETVMTAKASHVSVVSDSIVERVTEDSGVKMSAFTFDSIIIVGNPFVHDSVVVPKFNAVKMYGGKYNVREEYERSDENVIRVVEAADSTMNEDDWKEVVEEKRKVPALSHFLVFVLAGGFIVYLYVLFGWKRK